ncbi:MAG: hypothetical protein RBS07_07195 [Lentimicrobium sp.]|jgi:hypothetical protein|nr:hypothetical protein [Lentimicrobium sp.]
MSKRSYATELQEAIQFLEEEQAFKLQLLKEDFQQAYESLKPANLIKNTLKEVSASPYLINNLLIATVGLAAGYVSKKAITGRSHNILIRSLGVMLQFGITNLIAFNPKVIKSFGNFISHHISPKME